MSRLKEGAMWHDAWKPEETAVARLRFGKHLSAATNTHATTEELLDTVFPMRSMDQPSICSQNKEGS
jgi:hypothetical protein